jgi:DNA-binding MarR family transcriptional regulator
VPPERLDEVIHQQTRLRILAALHRNGRASFTDLRDGLELTAGNVATHTARLEEAGYIRSERALTGAGFEAQFVITERGADAFVAYLADLRSLLSTAGLDGFP